MVSIVVIGCSCSKNFQDDVAGSSVWLKLWINAGKNCGDLILLERITWQLEEDLV